MYSILIQPCGHRGRRQSRQGAAAFAPSPPLPLGEEKCWWW